MRAGAHGPLRDSKRHWQSKLFVTSKRHSRRPRSEYTPDIDNVEAAFVKVAKTFGDHHRVTYGAWRDAGVPEPY